MTPIVTNFYVNPKIHAAWQAFFMERNFKHFVTLTYDKLVSYDTACKDLGMFRRRLYTKLYRDKPDQSLSFAGSLDFTESGLPHWHLLFEPTSVIPGLTQAQADKRFKDLVEKVWAKMVNTPFSRAGIDVRPAYAQEGVVRYVLEDCWCSLGSERVMVDHLAIPEGTVTRH